MNYAYFEFLKDFFGEVEYELREIQASDPEAFLRFIKTQCYIFFVFVVVFFLCAWVVTGQHAASNQKCFKRFIACVLSSVFLTVLMYYGFLYDFYCQAYGYVQYRNTPLLISSECLVFFVMHRMFKKHRKGDY